MFISNRKYFVYFGFRLESLRLRKDKYLPKITRTDNSVLLTSERNVLPVNEFPKNKIIVH